MVTTPHYDLDIDTTLGGDNASDYVIPSQKAIKAYVDNNTGSTVDQTFDPTSQAAQSGVAIEGELANYVKGQNGNTAVENNGYFSGLGYEDTNTSELYGVFVGYSSYGTGVILGATSNQVDGYVANVVPSGLSLYNVSGRSQALLTVSNNNLAVNGSEVALASDIPDISTKQDTLVSGTNIKTVNNTSLLGSGNIDTSEIFIAEYDVTSYLDVRDAIVNSRVVFCKYGSSLYLFHSITGGSSGEATFFGAGNLGYIDTITLSANNIWSSKREFYADTDLSNLSATGKTVIDGQWVVANESIISSNTSLKATSNLTKRITLPDDGYTYEVLLRGQIVTGSSSSNQLMLAVSGNKNAVTSYMGRCITRTSSSMMAAGTCTVFASYVASNSTNLTIARSNDWNGNCSELTVIAYRRVGTNT